ncbi:alanine racemase [Formosa agariphila KMM 3901]|uniref:Alanine racemase n=1 Tax=Formosa agariphila (strain DSM 15362 / KCTC 12365 / LMG 23005 / KMM 3901 / M-2Alg 35-1) TaxID=1347342 RepID=T2KGB1_FORAG|nr:alanine racemase [Formosa agariphila]CDF77750.1 alanine racemase [Formosa agariphila KMM 3901]
MPKAQETLLEIDLKALEHNVTYLKSRLQPATKFMAVVKSYAYGNAAVDIAKHLETQHADYFAVAYTYEGEQLRTSGITKPILVLHPQAISFNILIEHCLEPNLYSLKVLKEFVATAENLNQKNYPVHLKFNTGLNRLGFSEADIPEILSLLKNTEAIKVTSLFSHMGASEDLNEKEFTVKQIKTFKHVTHLLLKQLPYTPMLHMCNTSGILNYPGAHFDMVRSGIGMYGFGNSEKENSHFKPITTLKTVISQIHQIPIGDSVGYNRGHISNAPLTTATLPLGHADGIGREYGNGKGFVAINGQKAPIVGNTCMDMIMVDITTIDCNEGDEVIVFGDYPTAEEFAATANTISYELLTGLSQRIKRIVLK